MSPEPGPGTEELVIVAGEAEGGMRLDQFAAASLGGITRSQLKSRLVRITLQGKEIKPSFAVRPGDCFVLVLRKPATLDLAAEDMDLQILYQDAQVAVINKPAGMVVHPGAGNPGHTLVNGLLFLFPELKSQVLDGVPFQAGEEGADGAGESEAGDHDAGGEQAGEDDESLAGPSDPGTRGTLQPVLRPGIVHRLDKDTSGVIITARDIGSLAFLSRQFQERSTRKWYLALGSGNFKPDSARVEGFICRDPALRQRFVHDPARGKPADSQFHVLGHSGKFTLFLVRPRTGRTHQIRVHARHLGCPLVGDALYGRNTPFDRDSRLMLHALALEICLPSGGGPRRFLAPPPGDFLTVLAGLGLKEVLDMVDNGFLDSF